MGNLQLGASQIQLLCFCTVTTPLGILPLVNLDFQAESPQTMPHNNDNDFLYY